MASLAVPSIEPVAVPTVWPAQAADVVRTAATSATTRLFWRFAIMWRKVPIVRLMAMKVLLGVLLAAATLAAAPPQLLPVDEASKRPDFFSFRARLLRTIARHDTAALLAAVHPQIRNSFGDDGSIRAFREMWKLGAPRSEIWDALGTVLALGGSFQDEHTFVAPYVFSRWPNQLDAFEHVAVIGADVRVRSRADARATTSASVSFAILPVAGSVTRQDGWTAVRLEDGRVGYVASEYVRSPIDYRATFRFENRQWRLVSLVAGD